MEEWGLFSSSTYSTFSVFHSRKKGYISVHKHSRERISHCRFTMLRSSQEHEWDRYRGKFFSENLFFWSFHFCRISNSTCAQCVLRGKSREVSTKILSKEIVDSSLIIITHFRSNSYREYYYGLSESIEKTMETLIERLKESEKEGLLPPQQMPMTIHNPMVPPAHSAMFPSMVRHFWMGTWMQWPYSNESNRFWDEWLS